MLFEDGENVVVQQTSLGGYSITVPSQKIDLLTDQLDTEDISYEMEENFVNIDDMNDEMSTATILTFGPHVDVKRLQSILDHLD